MSNRNHCATHRHSNQPSSSTRPPDVYGTNRAHMTTIEKADGSEMTIWHYRVSKQHEANQPKMSPHEMIYNIARALQRENNQFSIVHQHSRIPVSVDEVHDDEDITNFASNCYTPKGETASTTLLIRITNNHDNAQNDVNPLDNLTITMNGKWHIYLDKFCGKASGMIGVFTDVLPFGVNWAKTAATIEQALVDRNACDEPLRVEVRPAHFSYNNGSEGRKSTTLVAVYAPREVMAEVKGICSQLAFATADKAGAALGLANSQWYPMKPLHSKATTRNVILEHHEKSIANFGSCTISASTYNLDEAVSTNECKELLPTSFATVTDVKTWRDLFYAIIKHEYHADINNIQAFEYHSGREGFKITAKKTKMHTVYEALFNLEDVSHHFATSRFRDTWPDELREYITKSKSASERIAIFTKDKQRDNNIRKEANRPPPTSYATAAVPQATTQPKVSQTRPKPDQNQNQNVNQIQNQNVNQIPREFETMCTSMSSLCKQTCNAIIIIIII